jgi:hypothetical protein
MKAESHWGFTKIYVHEKEFNDKFVRHIEGLDYNLLNVVLQQMNMTFVHVLTTEGFEMKEAMYLSIWLQRNLL